MSIDLEKKSKLVQINLEKRGILTAPTMRVVAAIDVSGSMGPAISNGALQRSFDQLLGVAVTFDDDGSIDVFEFDTDCNRLPTATKSDFGNYVSKNVRAKGGTHYAPAIRAIVKDMFSVPEEKKSGFLGGFFGKREAAPATADTSPVLVLFFTDGANSDSLSAVRTEISAAQKHDIYFQMVGVGGDQFRTLQALGDEFPNVGFIKLSSFGQSDEEVYNLLISTELCEWTKKFTKEVVIR